MMRFRDLMLKLFPRSLALRIEAESRSWQLRCPCGHTRSVWETGGLRSGARGNPKRLLRCPACGKLRWHRTERPPS